MVLNTETLVREAVVDVARSQLGKQFGAGNITPYGTWYGPGWERALFCAAGWSWCWNQAMGEADARLAISYQTHGGVAPKKRGFVWTVAIIEQHRSRLLAYKGLRPGDALLFKYPTSGTRNTNEVNHVDLIESNNVAGGYFNCIGFNVPKPGAPAGTDQSRGGGVYRRRIYYAKPDPYTGRTNPYLVGGIEMKAEYAAGVIRSEWSRIQKALTTLGYAKLMGTGEVGPATLAGISKYNQHHGPTLTLSRQAMVKHMEATVKKMANPTPTPVPAPAPTPEPPKAPEGPSLSERVQKVRVSGHNAYTTALALRDFVVPEGRGVFLVTRDSPDEQGVTLALARHSLFSDALPMPRGADLPSVYREFLQDEKPAWIRVAGGPNGVPDLTVEQAFLAAGLTLPD